MFKGTPNRNGRIPGATNRSNKIAREMFNNILELSLNQIEEDLRQLSPKDRLNVILKLAEFCVPKLRHQEMELMEIEPLKEIEIKIIN
jgi:hypothetical protein